MLSMYVILDFIRMGLLELRLAQSKRELQNEKTLANSGIIINNHKFKRQLN